MKEVDPLYLLTQPAAVPPPLPIEFSDVRLAFNAKLKLMTEYTTVPAVAPDGSTAVSDLIDAISHCTKQEVYAYGQGELRAEILALAAAAAQGALSLALAALPAPGSGPSGNDGADGPQGTQGFQGKAGKDGKSGLAGSTNFAIDTQSVDTGIEGYPDGISYFKVEDNSDYPTDNGMVFTVRQVDGGVAYQEFYSNELKKMLYRHWGFTSLEESYPTNLSGYIDAEGWATVGASSERTGHEAWKAFNSDEDFAGENTWIAAADPCWLQVTYIGPISIHRYEITTQYEMTADDIVKYPEDMINPPPPQEIPVHIVRCPIKWTLKGSIDGVTWVDLDSRESAVLPPGTTTSYSLVNPKDYVYYRLDIEQSANGDGAAIGYLKMLTRSDTQVPGWTDGWTNSGTQWFSGPTAPDENMGAAASPGDFYLDTVLGYFYFREATSWKGPLTTFNGWWHGEGVPSTAFGKRGHYYLSTDLGLLYIHNGTDWGEPIAIGGGGAGNMLKFKGQWNILVDYLPGEIVGFGGSAWCCITQNMGRAPVEGVYWSLFVQKGDTGAQGTAGSQGPRGYQGIGSIIRGAWSAAETYVLDDSVSYLGSLWIAKSENIGYPPDIYPSIWTQLVSRGPQGAGFQGPQGVQGPPGIASLTYLGVWNSSTYYELNNIVTRNGASYIPISANTNSPPENLTAWRIFIDRGYQGTQGYQGVLGLRGFQGYQGLKGATLIFLGDWSPTATYNIDDLVLYQGDSYYSLSNDSYNFIPSSTLGTKWQYFIRGVQGLQGRQGFQGVQGAQSSVQGPQGLQGAGTQGAQGAQGAQGSQGAQGRQGFQGIQGAQSSVQGPQGFQGHQGIQGAGFQGATGTQGPAGEQGFQGYQGISGPQGSTGKAFIISKKYYSIAELELDVNPTGIAEGEFAIIDTGSVADYDNGKIYKWTGIVYEFLVDVSGTQGSQGIQGYQGTQGVAFKIAKSYPTKVSLLADSSPIGILVGEYAIVDSLGIDDEDNGSIYYWDGISYAYITKLAGARGFQGTQGYQGLASTVQGPQGFQGYPGYQGAPSTVQGPQGYQGNQGLTGPQGTQGAPSSIQGPQGLSGVQGAIGFQGQTGPQGSQGSASNIQGPQGYQGPQGHQGFQGLPSTVQGYQGYQGAAGIGTQGAAGPPGVGNLTYLGAWDLYATYPPDVVVTYLGSTYASLVTNTSSDPSSLSSWRLFVSIGNQGVQGTQGLQGRQGFQGIRGEKGGALQAKGAWLVTEQYLMYDLVTYNGSTYYALTDTIGTPPPSNPWTLFVSSGLQGAQGLPSNVPGPQGVQGPQGLGIQGSVGPQGPQGPQGIVGETGVRGYQGESGYQGNQGSQGFQGNQGAGYQGPQGISGTLGTEGPQGLMGPQGAGFQGPQGSSGILGSQGPQGLMGPQGAGFQGSQGSEGLQGNQGAGFQGTQGSQGVQGYQGVQGLGFKIAKIYSSVSELSLDTSPVNIQAGEFALITTVDPLDEDNSKLFLWTGTVYEYTLDLSGASSVVGPQGEAGLQGQQGPQGQIGYQGQQGVQGTQGLLGPQGAGFQGPQGITGSQGPQGTQGLLGPQGAGFQGPQGIPGLQGPEGPQGLAGQQGMSITGATGPQGVQGTPGYGAQGSQGPQGAAGQNGATGQQGAAGSNGINGSTGPQGYQGLTGAGYQGVQGAQGTQGPQGTYFRGPWVGGIPYGHNDLVTYQGQTWICILAHEAVDPPAYASNLWRIFCEKGVQGPQGAQGMAGATLIYYGVWSSATTYPSGVLVTDGTSAYYSLVTNNLNNVPSTSPAAWSYFAKSGAQGVTGAQGPQGFVGAQGTQGRQGSPSTVQGPQGYQGYVGPQGLQGAASTIQGPQGQTGTQGVQGAQGAQGAQGIGFKIAKTYSSVANLLLDTSPTGINQGEFAVINTGNVSDEDNAKIYLWNGTGYQYTLDLSGATGIQGQQGIPGVGTQGPQGPQGASGSGTGSGGHQIKSDGVALAEEPSLNFGKSFIVSDDAGNLATNVELDGILIKYVGPNIPATPQDGELWLDTDDESLLPFVLNDVSSIASDYLLRIGEVVFLTYLDSLEVNLNVGVEEGFYEIIIASNNSEATSTSYTYYKPNGNTLAGQMQNHLGAIFIEDSFRIGYGILKSAKVLVTTATQNKTAVSTYLGIASNGFIPGIVYGYCTDVTTPWVSLGTIVFGEVQSGTIRITRLL